MAIIEAYPNIKVEVVVNRRPLSEFIDDDEEVSPNTTTKYIEASSGDTFAVRYTMTPGFHTKHDLVARLYVDGKRCDGHVIYPGNPLQLGKYKYMSGTRTVINDQFFCRKFRFSQLETNDSDIREFGDALKKTLENIGIITLKFHWIKVNGPAYHPHAQNDEISKLDTIPEKALKGRTVSHQASLGDLEPNSSFKTVPMTYIYGPEPFAIYNFKYRSRNALKSLMIIPRTPSPVPLEDREINTLTPDEMRQLLHRKRAQEDAKQIIKQENIKRERTQRRSANVGEDGYDDEVSFVSSKRRRLPVTLNQDGTEMIDLT